MISSSKHSVTRGSLVVALVLLATSGNSFASEQCGEMLPDTMRSVRIHAKGGPENLKPETIPRAQAAAGEVLVRVSYASVNPGAVHACRRAIRVSAATRHQSRVQGLNKVHIHRRREFANRARM